MGFLAGAGIAALNVLRWLLRHPKVLAGLVLAAVIAGGAVYIDHLQARVKARDVSLAQLGKELTQAEETNQLTLAAMEEIEREREHAEMILGERLDRKAQESDRLAALVKRVMSHDAKACPIDPAMDDVLDAAAGWLPGDVGGPAP